MLTLSPLVRPVIWRVIVPPYVSLMTGGVTLSVAPVGGAGGVTSAHEVPMRSSSTIIPAGSAGLRLNNRKLATVLAVMSPPDVAIKGVAGALAAPNVELEGFIHRRETSSLVLPVLIS